MLTSINLNIFQKKEPDVDEWFESENQRELRQIFEGQSQLYELYKEFSKKLDELGARQTGILDLLSRQGGVQVPQGQVPQPGIHGESGILRQEVTALFSNQNQIVNTGRELK